MGESWRTADWCYSTTRRVKETGEAEDKIRDLIDKGAYVSYNAIYACPYCREWVDFTTPYIYEPIRVTPLGTVREYKMHYLRGNPICEKCGSDLYHIFNPLSTNNPCPKCGADNMKAIKVGSFD